jgi:hypothetical protein
MVETGMSYESDVVFTPAVLGQKRFEEATGADESLVPGFVGSIPPTFFSKRIWQHQIRVMLLKESTIGARQSPVFAVLTCDFKNTPPFVQIAIGNGRDIQRGRDGEGCFDRPPQQTAVNMGDTKAAPVKGVTFVGPGRRIRLRKKSSEETGLGSSNLR